jgi:hypothetical protein
MKTAKLLLLLAAGFASLCLNAQSLKVQGTIKDGSNGEPVPFASLVVKGTSVWTTSDADGQYSFVAPANGVISVECLGYVSQ